MHPTIKFTFLEIQIRIYESLENHKANKQLMDVSITNPQLYYLHITVGQTKDRTALLKYKREHP